jgi:hypothetical protein
MVFCLVKECMSGSLDKTRVLYAPVEEVGREGRLLNACRILISLSAYFYLCEDMTSNYYASASELFNSLV